MKLDAVIFDMDGTLTDSMTVVWPLQTPKNFITAPGHSLLPPAVILILPEKMP